MKFIFWILAIVALILLFPIPLKINLIYDKGIFTLKLFNKTIIPSKTPNKTSSKKEKKKKTIETPSGEKIKKFKIKDIKHIIDFLSHTKLKFFIWTNTDIEYSLDDAAISALSYGLLHQLSALIHGILKVFFRVKKYNYNINMKYNENFFKVENSSIILLNLATIIYMVIKISYDYIERREPSSKLKY